MGFQSADYSGDIEDWSVLTTGPRLVLPVLPTTLT